MVKYSCEKCGKIFKQKGHYTNHLNRKNPCIIDSKIKEYIETIVDEKIKNLKNIDNINNIDKIKAISLFSGAGGDSLGIKEAGLDLVAYSEKERIFRETHALNFKNCKYSLRT